MIDDEELEEGYVPSQFKKETIFESDVASTFVESLQWRTDDQYFIEIKHRMTGKMKEKGGPYSFLFADQIMRDLKSKDVNQQYLITMKRIPG